jgi:hypothetical protein
LPGAYAARCQQDENGRRDDRVDRGEEAERDDASGEGRQQHHGAAAQNDAAADASRHAGALAIRHLHASVASTAADPIFTGVLIRATGSIPDDARCDAGLFPARSCMA